MKLTEHKHFKELMRHWFNNKRKSMKAIAKRQRLNREDLERFMANEKDINGNQPMHSFYLKNIRRGARGIQTLSITNPKDHTKRKKRN